MSLTQSSFRFLQNNRRCRRSQTQSAESFPSSHRRFALDECESSRFARPESAGSSPARSFADSQCSTICEFLLTLFVHRSETLVYQRQNARVSGPDNLYQQELSRITDQQVEFSLRSADASAGKWLQEDPPLSTVQRMIGA